jgi:hypothetical protein
VTDLFAYWQDYPPTHVLVVAYLSGGKKNSSASAKAMGKRTGLDQLSQAVVDAGGAIHKRLPNIYKV